MISSRYVVIKAPFGSLYLTAEDNAVVRITPYKPPSMAAFRYDALPALSRVTDDIVAYLCGNRVVFDPLPSERFSAFQYEVYTAVSRIPYGETATSAQIAAAIGKPHAVRAVEELCRENPYWIAIPCHRVVLLDETVERGDRPLSAVQSLRHLEKRACQPHTAS